jgi:WD40 repeat protein
VAEAARGDRQFRRLRGGPPNSVMTRFPGPIDPKKKTLAFPRTTDVLPRHPSPSEPQLGECQLEQRSRRLNRCPGSPAAGKRTALLDYVNLRGHNHGNRSNGYQQMGDLMRLQFVLPLILFGQLVVRPHLTNAMEDPPAKVAVPSKEDQHEASKLVEEVYKDDFDAAKKPSKRAEIAKKLLKEGIETSDSLDGKYVLLTHSLKFAIDAGDATTAVLALDELAKFFEVDELAVRSEALQMLTKHIASSAQADTVIISVKRSTDQAIFEDRLEIAERLLTSGIVATKRLKNVKASLEFTAKLRRVQQLKAELDRISDARKTLEEQPADASANLAVGKYRCLRKGDWSAGLPMLVLGADKNLSSLAEADLALPTPSEKAAAVGDGWWAYAEDEKEADSTEARLRAVYWYKRSAAGLSGLEKARIEKRIKAVDSLKNAALYFNLPSGIATRLADSHRLNLNVKRRSRILRRDPKNNMSEVAFSPDGKTIAFGDASVIRVADIDGTNEGAPLAGPGDPISCLAFSHDGKFIVGGSRDKTIRVWDLGTSRLKTTIEGSEGPILSVAYSPDDTHIIASDAQSVRIWKPSGKQLANVHSATFAIWPHQNKFVAFDQTNGTTPGTYAFNFQGAKLERIADRKSQPILYNQAMVVSADGQFLAVLTSTFLPTANIFDIKSKEIRTSVSLGSNALSIAASSDGAILGSAGSEGVILWNTRTWQEICSISTDGQNCWSVAFSPTGAAVAFLRNSPNSVEIWNVIDGAP